MLKFMISIFCLAVTFVNCKNSTMRCQDGRELVNGSFLQFDSKCVDCRLCAIGNKKQFEYIQCPSYEQLDTCHQELYLEFWRFQALKEFKFNIKPSEDKKNVSGENKIGDSGTGKTTTLVWEGHIPVPLAVGICLIVPGAALLTVLIYYVLNRKMKKQKQSNYDAIQSRIRHQHREDENYIRYTEDPTSSSFRNKHRMRASWPRAARPENRYLLEVVSGEPASDSGSTSREDNPDSNSAQYVFIETFPSAAATADPRPSTNRTDEAQININESNGNI